MRIEFRSLMKLWVFVDPLLFIYLFIFYDYVDVFYTNKIRSNSFSSVIVSFFNYSLSWAYIFLLSGQSNCDKCEWGCPRTSWCQLGKVLFSVKTDSDVFIIAHYYFWVWVEFPICQLWLSVIKMKWVFSCLVIKPQSSILWKCWKHTVDWRFLVLIIPLWHCPELVNWFCHLVPTTQTIKSSAWSACIYVIHINLEMFLIYVCVYTYCNIFEKCMTFWWFHELSILKDPIQIQV